MIRFLDGPANGVMLQLSRSPKFLRVVCDESGTWDALDQVIDTPEKEESVYVYRLESNEGTVHIDGRDKNGKRFGKWLAVATYRYHDNQPDESVMRDNYKWRQWATAENDKIKPTAP